MVDQVNKTLAKDLTANFGLGKDQDKASVISAGTEIGRIWQDKGWTYFMAKEFGKWATYKVKKESVLQEAIQQ